MEYKLKYVRRVPKKLPPGMALAHNFQPVPIQAMNPGLGGFRCFLIPKSAARAEWKVCNCGFAPHLKEHYRNKGYGRTIHRKIQLRSNPQPDKIRKWLQKVQPELTERELDQKIDNIFGRMTEKLKRFLITKPYDDSEDTTAGVVMEQYDDEYTARVRVAILNLAEKKFTLNEQTEEGDYLEIDTTDDDDEEVQA
jgi:hypothetical protein